MSTQSDPLRKTTQELHRFWFHVTELDQWYSIMRECRMWFGTNWTSMSKVRRKLEPGRRNIRTVPVAVWFDVPDPRFAIWISIKMSLQVQSESKFNQKTTTVYDKTHPV